MARKYGLILCCLMINIIQVYHVDCGDVYRNGFVKHGNSFEANFGNESSQAFAEEYVETVNNLLRDYKAGKIQHEALNTFNKGLEEYFVTRLYERFVDKEYANLKPIIAVEPLRLPDYVDREIYLRDVKGFGSSSLNRPGRPLAVGCSASGRTSKITLDWELNAIIITGNFEIFDSTYFFVYTWKQHNATTYIHLSPDSTGDPISLKTTLNFGAEQLLHTYDSSYDRYTEANEIFVRHFNLALSQHYLRHFATWAVAAFVKPALECDLKVKSSYKKSILSVLAESAVQYATAKGLNTFEVTPVNFTNSAGPRTFVLSYKDIKVDGILNFVDHRVVNSTIESSGPSKYQAKFTDTIELAYADEGEKQAYVSFAVNDGRRENVKKFKIKAIRIVAAYNSTVGEYSAQVVRDKEAFFNGSGFLIEFELRDFDVVYEFLIRHIGNDIARAFGRILDGDAVSNATK